MPFQLPNVMQPLLWLRLFTLEEDFITLQSEKWRWKFLSPVYQVCIFYHKQYQELMPTYLDGDPDWNIVSRAWWDAVDLIEKSEADKGFAVDMTLELRVMGGSEV